MSEKALICVKTYDIDRLETLKEFYRRLNSKLPIESISSIYKVKFNAETNRVHNIQETSVLDGLTVVFLVNTDLSAEKVLSLIKSIENQLIKQSRQVFVVKLLLFGSRVSIKPGLTLPYPEFYLRPEELTPALDLCPQFTHPVLKKKLIALAKELKKTGWGEFYAQGKSLLDKPH